MKKKLFEIRDLILLLGIVSISYGLYNIYSPAMYLFIGAALIFVGRGGE